MVRRFTAVCIGLLLVASCATVEEVREPTVNLIGMSMGRPGFLQKELVLTLRIGNPNDFAVPLEGLSMTIEINGRKLADGLSDESVTLPRLGHAEFAVQTTASTFDLVRELIALGGEDAIEYRITGTAYVATPFGRRAVPYERTGSLSLLLPAPRAPEDRAPSRRDDEKAFRAI